VGISTFEDDLELLTVPPLGEPKVRLQPIGHHHTARHDGLLNELAKTVRRRVTDTPHPNTTNCPAADFCYDRHKGLSVHVTMASPRFHAPNKRFVHLDLARESVAFGANHGQAQLVEPRPSRAVTPQPQYLLQGHRIGSVFLARQPPHRSGTTGATACASCGRSC
jgi:hypothetical protein